jgi:hypothetical protein
MLSPKVIRHNHNNICHRGRTGARRARPPVATVVKTTPFSTTLTFNLRLQILNRGSIGDGSVVISPDQAPEFIVGTVSAGVPVTVTIPKAQVDITTFDLIEALGPQTIGGTGFFSNVEWVVAHDNDGNIVGHYLHGFSYDGVSYDYYGHYFVSNNHKTYKWEGRSPTYYTDTVPGSGRLNIQGVPYTFNDYPHELFDNYKVFDSNGNMTFETLTISIEDIDEYLFGTAADDDGNGEEID